MAGICAIVRWDGAPAAARVTERMAAAAPYRGDGRALATDACVLVGQELPGAGNASQAAAHGLLVVADARIDNADELVPQLGDLLPAAAGATAADLIVAAHLRWGDDAPRRLVGDFAYVLFDATRRRLHAVRDPLAMRPLYVHHDARRTLVASEIQQLLAAGDVPTAINEAMVARYLVGEFGAPTETFYRGVDVVPGGHAWRADTGGARATRYWEVDPAQRVRLAGEADYAERFRELLARSVADRLRAPGPHGLLLSGGVDSGSVGAMAGWLHETGRTTERLHAYSFAFPTLPECDERHLSGQLVARYHLPAHDVPAEASPPLARFPDHGPHRDEPYMGVYQALIESSAATARADGLRQLWSGDRGDLLVGAWWPDAVGLARHGRWRDLLDVLREDAALPGRHWPSVLTQHLLAPGAALVRRRLMGRRRSGPRTERTDPRRPPWLRPAFHERVGVDPADDLGPVPPDDLVGYRRRQRYRLVFLPMHMRGMVWSERTNALFGLGFIDAWSDRRLVEYVLAIPQAVLDRPRRLDKRLAREALRGIMPEPLRQGAAKIVPSPLYRRALRQDAVATIRGLLRDMEAERRGYLDGDALRSHYAAVVGGANDHPTLWWALTLEMWLRRYWR